MHWKGVYEGLLQRLLERVSIYAGRRLGIDVTKYLFLVSSI